MCVQKSPGEMITQGFGGLNAVLRHGNADLKPERYIVASADIWILLRGTRNAESGRRSEFLDYCEWGMEISGAAREAIFSSMVSSAATRAPAEGVWSRTLPAGHCGAGTGDR